jgi:hypothetical protein
MYGRDKCDISGYLDLNFVQRHLNRTADNMYENWTTVAPVHTCNITAPNSSSYIDPFLNAVCPDGGRINMVGGYESKILAMYEIDFSFCKNETLQLGDPKLENNSLAEKVVKSYHPKECAPQEEIDAFMTSDEMRCFLVEINSQVDASYYFGDTREYYVQPKEDEILEMDVLRQQRYNYLSGALKKVEIHHTVQTYELASAMIATPVLEVEKTDVNWDVSSSIEGISNQVRKGNFLRLYMRMAHMKRKIRIEPEMNVSGLMEGIGGMAEYLMLVLYGARFWTGMCTRGCYWVQRQLA